MRRSDKSVGTALIFTLMGLTFLIAAVAGCAAQPKQEPPQTQAATGQQESAGNAQDTATASAGQNALPPSEAAQDNAAEELEDEPEEPEDQLYEDSIDGAIKDIDDAY